MEKFKTFLFTKLYVKHAKIIIEIKLIEINNSDAIN